MKTRTFDEQYERAKKAGEEANKNEPRAESARYDSRTKRVVVRLRNGEDFSFSPEWVPGLRGASSFDLANIEVTPSGGGLHWESLDEDLSVPALLQGVFGPANAAENSLPVDSGVFENLCAQIEIGWNTQRDAAIVDRLASENTNYSRHLYDFFALLIESEVQTAESEESEQTSENTIAWLEKEGYEMAQQIVEEQRDETPDTTPVASTPVQTSTPKNYKALVKERTGFEDEEIDEKIAPTNVIDFIQRQDLGTYKKSRAMIVKNGQAYGIDENEGNQAINAPQRMAARRGASKKKPTLREIVSKTRMTVQNRKIWLEIAKEDEG